MPTNMHVHAHTRTYMPACPDIHPPTIKVLALLHEEPGTLVPLLLQQLLHGHRQAEKREQITLFQTGYCFPGKYTAVSVCTRMNSNSTNTEPRCAEHVGHTVTWQTQATSAMQRMKLISVLNADRYSGQQVTLFSSVLVMPLHICSMESEQRGEQLWYSRYLPSAWLGPMAIQFLGSIADTEWRSTKQALYEGSRTFSLSCLWLPDLNIMPLQLTTCLFFFLHFHLNK